jgi:glycosyltransferase involved in cell wall biosynthesis
MICLNGDCPRVSVITCAYNHAHHIRTAIDSILAQTYTDFELLVIDDGSTDKTPEVVRKAAAADRRIRVATQSHQGIPRTLNNALALTRGAYIALQDDDDTSFPERLEKQVAFLDTHPHAAAVACYAELIGFNIFAREKASWPLDPAELRNHILEEGGWLIYQNALMRRSSIDFVGGYRVEFPICEDIDLFLRLMDHFQVETIPEVLYRYRRTQKSVTYGADTLIELYGSIARELARQRMRDGRDLLMR